MSNHTIKKLKILIVEDHEKLAKIHRLMLEELGHTPDIATSGEEALAKAKNAYDLIFMDIGLPGISGAEAATRIRLEEANKKRAYIVALTAYAGKEVQEKYQQKDIDLIKIKPIYMREMREILSLF